MIATEDRRAERSGWSAASDAAPGAAAPPRPADVSRSATSPRPWRAPGGAGLTWRIFGATAAVVATVLAVALFVTTVAIGRAGDAVARDALDPTRRLVAARLEGRARGLAAGALVFAEGPHFRALLLGGRREDLLDQAAEAAARVGASWVQIADAAGVRLAKSDEPAAPALPLAGSALVAGALAGETALGAGVSGDSALAQLAAVPVVGTARVDGVLVAALVADAALARALARETGGAVAFYVLDAAGVPRVTASSLGHAGAIARHVARTLAEPPAGGVDASSADSSAPRPLALGGGRYLAQVHPLRSAGGEPLGGFVVLRGRDAVLAPLAALRRAAAGAGVLGVALTLLLSYLLAQRIVRPVRALADAARRAAGGDFSATVDVGSADGELAALAGAMRTMLADLREKHDVVEVFGDTSAPAGGGGHDADAPPVVAGRYHLLRRLGAGGMGVVYLARDAALDETVAVKMLRPEVRLADPTAVERFKAEIRLARRITHRNVVRTFDLGVDGGLSFLTMEYVAGTSLAALLAAHGRLPVRAAVAIAAQLCRALAAAHAQGVVHRDVKPQNLLVRPDGVLKVLDFGVARAVQAAGGVTHSGASLGTPEYMAPEQLFGEPVDARADLYAAGAVLYECLTGRPPFGAGPPAVLAARMLTEPLEAPHQLRADVPPALSTLVLRALDQVRDRRPQTAAELRTMLEAVA